MRIMKKPTALIILDGYGIAKDKKQSAIDAAATPVMDSLLKKYAQDISVKRMKHREQKHDDCGCD